MQKLEEILKAEDTARHAVAEARERAKAVVKDAEASATELSASQRTRTLDEITAIEREVDQAAQEEAASIRERAASDLNDELARATGRMSDVVERIVAELAG